MSEVPSIFGRITAMHEEISTSLDEFGGFLRCEECQRIVSMGRGDAGKYTSHGWPRCCGYTMRWWTQRQIDAGEVPSLPASASGRA